MLYEAEKKILPNPKSHFDVPLEVRKRLGSVGYKSDIPHVQLRDTLQRTNIAMESGPFEDVFPTEHVDIQLLC